MRDWLLGKEGTARENDVDSTQEETLDLRKPSKKMRQLELEFVKILTPDVQQEDIQESVEIDSLAETVVIEKEPAGKRDQPAAPKRRKTLKKLAKENAKMTTWLKPVQMVVEPKEVIYMESIERDSPEVEDPARIMRREAAKLKQKEWVIKKMARELVSEMVDGIPARSVVDKVLANVMTMSTWRISMNSVWKLLEDDLELQEVVKKKMLRQEQEVAGALEAMEKEDRLAKGAEMKHKFTQRQRDRRVVQEKQQVDLEVMMNCLSLTILEEETVGQERVEDMDWGQLELEEHMLLDDWQITLGLELYEDWVMVDEVEEHKYLDDLLMELEDRQGSQEEECTWRSTGILVGDGLGDIWCQEDVEDCDQMVTMRMTLGSQDDEDSGGVGVKVDDDVLVPKMILVNESGYHTNGTWYLDNWMMPSTVPTSKQTNRIANLEPVSFTKRRGKNNIMFGGIVMEDKKFFLSANIIGVKGAASSRKRSSSRCSGGWISRWCTTGTGPRSAWKTGVRRISKEAYKVGGCH